MSYCQKGLLLGIAGLSFLPVFTQLYLSNPLLFVEIYSILLSLRSTIIEVVHIGADILSHYGQES